MPLTHFAPTGVGTAMPAPDEHSDRRRSRQEAAGIESRYQKLVARGYAPPPLSTDDGGLYELAVNASAS